MNPSSFLARLLPIALAALVATACASESSSREEGSFAGGSDEVGSTEDEVRASCGSPRKFFATFRDRSAACSPVVGRRGRWVPEPLFRDAPADVQATTCAFRWSGAKGAPPDSESLYTAVGRDNGLAPACGRGSDVSSGNLKQIPSVDNVILAGSVGCDVCGLVRGRVIFVVLPPEKILLKQFDVRLSNGEDRAFQIEPTEASALRVTLPPPPPGTEYEQGHVQIL